MRQVAFMVVLLFDQHGMDKLASLEHQLYGINTQLKTSLSRDHRQSKTSPLFANYYTISDIKNIAYTGFHLIFLKPQ